MWNQGVVDVEGQRRQRVSMKFSEAASGKAPDEESTAGRGMISFLACFLLLYGLP